MLISGLKGLKRVAKYVYFSFLSAKINKRKFLHVYNFMT